MSEKIPVYKTPCSDIKAEQWEALPRILRVYDYCIPCEEKCSHGKGLIYMQKKIESVLKQQKGGI